MNSNSNYSQFIEHSFRRLTLLIHQQNDPDASTSISADKTTGQSSNTSSSLINNQKRNMNKNELESFPLKEQSHRRSMSDNESTKSIDTKLKVEPLFRTHRTFMRPPKNRTTISYRCSSSQSSDQPETFFDHSSNTPCSLSVTQQKSNELPIHMPHERSLYDIKFERDRQNDIREKYNIPLPFQRKWLRQPRYVPQERPNIGQIKQSENP